MNSFVNTEVFVEIAFKVNVTDEYEDLKRRCDNTTVSHVTDECPCTDCHRSHWVACDQGPCIGDVAL